jgi:flagellar biosynthesis protein FlhA
MMRLFNGTAWMGAVRGGVLPIAILMLVTLMIVPVPALVLDMGFIANIVISLAVLMVAMNAAKPLDFSAFPTVLLLATLFRLALNVASTRVVLVEGHKGPGSAGHVIEAFGSFIIGGNYIVGIFVFTVLMIINLVVITKGAGRVSEVSARFTLDALPGKQMAIDADLNAGLMTPDEAKARRIEVSTEADFYGSMDGASKFVKGDAVAAILILFVNIFGGLLLGVISHGLSLSEAAQTYIQLAIGDGLVAQVPALLLSIAAASIVTRVTSPLDLSGQISSQFAQLKAWVPVAVSMAILGVMPGMPHFVLLSASALITFYCWRLKKRQVIAAAVVQEPLIEEPLHSISWSDISESAPITLELGYGLIDLVDERKGAPLMGRITGIRKQVSRDLGFVLPLVRVKDNLALSANQYQIIISGIILGDDEAWLAELLALDAGDNPDKVDGRPVKDPSFGLDAVWIAEANRADAIVAGYTVVDAPTVIATHLNTSIASSAATLFGLDDGQAMLDTLRSAYPQLANGLTPQPYSLAIITGVCRSLLAERVPLRDFRQIAEALITLAPQSLDAAALVEGVRQQIGALIVQTIVPTRMPLPVITFAPDLEALLVQSVAAGPGALWPFEPALAQRIVLAVRDAVEPELMAARAVAILTPPVCRPAVARLLRAHLSEVPVLSVLEIPETKTVEVIAVVGGDGSQQNLLPSATVPLPTGEN